MNKPEVITICQRKGGVGKSSSTLNMAYALATQGHKVLVVDLDDQQNTTTSISAQMHCDKTITELLMDEKLSVNDVKVSTEWKNVWMIPASDALSGVTKHLDGEVGGHHVLKEKLSAAKDVDYILIDTGPSLNILVINAFCASDFLFIPLSSQYFSLQGLLQTLDAFRKAKSRLNEELILLGMAFVIYDKRNTLAKEIVENVRAKYGSLVFDSMIGTNIRIEEAQVNQQSILTYAPKDRGAIQYKELGEEVFKRIETYRKRQKIREESLSGEKESVR